MGKIADMAETIEELRNAAAAINDVANRLTVAFSSESAPVTDPASAACEPEPVLTLEEVRAVLGQKSRAGYTDAVRGLLQQFGAAKLSEVNPSDYAALLKAAEELDHGA